MAHSQLARGLTALAVLVTGCAAPPPRTPMLTSTPLATPTAVPVIGQPIPAATPTLSAAATPLASSSVITYEVAGGITGRLFTWVIHADGQVETAAGEVASVPARQVAALLADLSAAGFEQLDDLYPNDSCADCQVLLITVARDGAVKHVEAVDDGNLPPDVQRSIAVLQAFVAGL